MRVVSRLMSQLIRVITARDPETRNCSLDALCRAAPLEVLLAECAALDRFRRTSDNLYERVRALFFLYAIHRFHLLVRRDIGTRSQIPFGVYVNLLKRRFQSLFGWSFKLDNSFFHVSV